MKHLTFLLVSFTAFFGLTTVSCASGESESKDTNIPASFVSEQPSATAEGSVTLKTGFDYPRYYVSEGSNEGHFYVEAKTGKLERADSKRTPLNLSIVIDRSGSMDGAKLSYAKQAAQYVVDQLTEEDQISIVVYDDVVRVLAQSQSVQNKQSLRAQIGGVVSGGSTNLHGGMMEGYRQVKLAYRSGYVNRVLLLSDGLANVGISSTAELIRIARNKQLEEGITISAFGIGADFNEDLMTGLAEEGMGNYYFINNPEEIPNIFRKELNGLLAVVAQDAVVTVNLPEGVKLDRVYGAKYEQSGNRVIVKFRDVFAEETKAFLIKFHLEQPLSPRYALETILTYQDATLENRPGREIKQVAELTLAKTLDERNEYQNKQVIEQVILFESNDRMERAFKMADQGDYSGAKQVVEENEDYLRKNQELVRSSPELQRQESTNSKYKSSLDEVRTMSTEDIKVMQKSTKSSNYELRNKK